MACKRPCLNCFICRNGNAGFRDKEVWIRGFYTTSLLPLLCGLGKQREACLSFSSFQMSLLRRTVLTPPSSFNAHFTIHAALHTLIPPPLSWPSLLKRHNVLRWSTAENCSPSRTWCWIKLLWNSKTDELYMSHETGQFI